MKSISDLQVNMVPPMVMSSYRSSETPISFDTSTPRTISPTEINDRLDALQKHLQQQQDVTNVQLEYNKDIDRVVVRYVSATSGEVVQQFPTARLVEFEKEYMRTIGLLFDIKF